MKSYLIAPVFIFGLLTGCGTSESIMKDRYSALPTSVLCQKLIDGDLASWQEKWAGQIINERGASCDGVRPSPRSESQQIIIKDCSNKNYGGGFWGGLAQGLDGC